jgi:triosephosphate isomerase
MSRRLIVGNWKMHKTASEAAAFVHHLSRLVPETGEVEVVLAPPFTALQAAMEAMPDSHVFNLAAQDLFWEDQGPFTGEVSAPMLKDLGCKYVIVGHSERRQFFGDNDQGINRKIRASLRHGLRPIACVGESLADRESGRTEAVVTGQVLKSLDGISKEHFRMVTIAYEPIWAIGTGHAASTAQAVAVHKTIRSTLAEHWGAEACEAVRVLYGGSVTPHNARDFLASDQVDGALVGGSCLDPEAFARIISLARTIAQQDIYARGTRCTPSQS